jgi:hypothetical protein
MQKSQPSLHINTIATLSLDGEEFQGFVRICSTKALFLWFNSGNRLLCASVRALRLYFVESKNGEDEKGDESRRAERSFHYVSSIPRFASISELSYSNRSKTGLNCLVLGVKSRFDA